MKKYCFGVDIGGTTVKIGLFDISGKILDKWEIPTKVDNDGESVLSDIAASVMEKLKEKDISREEVLGMGIGVPGSMNEEGMVIHAANLGWEYKEVTKEMEDLTGFPCKGANDANVAALGEMWKGAAAGHSNGVMVTLGTGVGGGIIVNGMILAGVHGAGGEIGHIHVDDQIPGHCGCGKQGCLEQVASANGIVRLAKWMIQNMDEVRTSLDTDTMSAKDIWDAVKDGDEFAVSVAVQFGKYLGTALANIASVVDPEVFIIGGGMSKAGLVILDYVQKYYIRYAFKGCRYASFRLASLGNDAGIYGAAKMILGT